MTKTENGFATFLETIKHRVWKHIFKSQLRSHNWVHGHSSTLKAAIYQPTYAGYVGP